MAWDRELAELENLAEEQRWLRYEEMHRELAQRTRDQEMRRCKALEEKADAIQRRLDVIERLVLRLILRFAAVVAAAVLAVEAARLFISA